MDQNVSAWDQRTVRISVLVPCLNEEQTVAKVVKDFRREIPEACIYVFDNCSVDGTAAVARAAGATVIPVPRQGKGFVVQSMFRNVDADIYIMVDGDDTYPAEAARKLVGPVLSGEADMVVGSRLMKTARSQFTISHRFGNWMYATVIRLLFGISLTDVLSGYRVMSRDIVKTVPILSTGFEVEADLTIKTLERNYRLIELPVDLRRRIKGSHSKIRMLRDGMRILASIFLLFRDYKPMTFFSLLGVAIMCSGLIPGGIVIEEFLATGLILHMPSAVLSVGLELAGMLCFLVGLILDVVNRRFREIDYEFRMSHRA